MKFSEFKQFVFFGLKKGLVAVTEAAIATCKRLFRDSGEPGFRVPEEYQN